MLGRKTAGRGGRGGFVNWVGSQLAPCCESEGGSGYGPSNSCNGDMVSVRWYGKPVNSRVADSVFEPVWLYRNQRGVLLYGPLTATLIPSAENEASRREEDPCARRDGLHCKMIAEGASIHSTVRRANVQQCSLLMKVCLPLEILIHIAQLARPAVLIDTWTSHPCWLLGTVLKRR